MKEALIGVVVGWILSQLTYVFNDWVDKLQKRKDLASEIEDLKKRADSMIESCQFSLENMQKGGYMFTSPSEIYTHVKDAAFPYVFSSYTSTERAGVISVYELVDQINDCVSMPDDSNYEKLKKLCDIEVVATRLSITADEFISNPKNNRLITKDDSFQDEILVPKLNAVFSRYNEASKVMPRQ